MAPDPAAVLASVMRQDRGRILAALIARTRSFQLSEDALQEAAASALQHWARSGPPLRPQAWLIRMAFRKAIDHLRRDARDGQRAAALAVLARDEAMEDPEQIPDERLRLIFACCHPALEPKSQVALTLRTVCGLATAEIARAFLDAEPTMGQRLSRARARLAQARVPFAVPDAEAWPARLQSVLTVIYLIFNAGYTAGPQAERDLCGEAIFLARLLNDLRPGEAECEGCLALMLITHARRHARINAAGETVPPEAQDRRLWNSAEVTEGFALIARALAREQPGPHQIKAAIAACHLGPQLAIPAPQGPDWPQIATLYDSLLRFEPTPVVRLNAAVARAEAGALGPALGELAALEPDLAGYQPFHAAMAELQARAGDRDAALAAYARAIDLAASPADAAFLARRRNLLLS